ncbi:efflux RND transporter periplasmic adaptor subunit [bacterium]|nr:efflux RND transporter periplasmic adaptor subunit [bacterium]
MTFKPGTRFVVSSLLVTTVLATAALDLALRPAAAQTAPAAQGSDIALPAITVTNVVTRKVEDHVLASGLISPVEQVAVVPLIEGQPIETLEADVGDTVKAGQILAKLSTATLTLQQSQLKASLASAQSTAAEAQRTADRTAALFAQGSAPSATNDQAQSALIAAKAQVAAVQAQLDTVALQISRAQVVAPVDGVISARNGQIGAIASAAGQPMFVLIRDGALELRADVAEADLPRVKEGQTATIRLAADLPPQTGKIRLVEPTVDVTTRLGRARIALDHPDQARAGMYAEADILVTARTGLAVPVTAVGSEGSETTVMTVKDGTVHRTKVTTGIRDGGWVEITSGLAEGDQIVAKAGAFVADGDKIKPVSTATN